jgi:hypothetical protein
VFYDCKRFANLDVRLMLIRSEYLLLNILVHLLVLQSVEIHDFCLLVDWHVSWQLGMHMMQKMSKKFIQSIG